MTDVVIDAKVSGPELPMGVPQQMRAVGDTRERAVHNLKVRAAEQGHFGTDEIADIEILHAEVIDQ